MTIEELYRDYCARCVRHFMESRKAADTDDLHDFRVAVRRLKMLVTLLESMGVALWPKARRKQINLAFRLAGELRDYQTQVRLCSYWSRRLKYRFVSFRSALSSLVRDARDRFETHLAGVPLDVLMTVTPDIDQKIRQADWSAMKQAIQQETACIPELLARSVHADPKSIHPLRIRIKRAKYVLDVMHELYDRTEESSGLRDRLSAMQDRFGFWHDLEIHRELAKSFMKGSHLTEPQIARIVALREAIARAQTAVLIGTYAIPSEFV